MVKASADITVEYRKSSIELSDLRWWAKKQPGAKPPEITLN